MDYKKMSEKDRYNELNKGIGCVNNCLLQPEIYEVNNVNMDMYDRIVDNVATKGVYMDDNKEADEDTVLVIGSNIAIHDIIRNAVVYNREYKVVRTNTNPSNHILEDIFKTGNKIALFDVVMLLDEKSEFTGKFGVYMGYDVSDDKHIFVTDLPN